MTTIHKTYNPKTASVTDIYHVDDDGHDRWFIPMLEDTETDTGPATMAQQLAQCQKLSPHGTGKDEQPDLPLVITQVGSVTGNLMMGGKMVGDVAKAKDGAKPYVVQVQKQTSTDATTWINNGGLVSPDENWQITWNNSQNDGGKYWRIVTTITDAEAAVLTDKSDSYGPVQVVNAGMVGPDPSEMDLNSGSTIRVKWNGYGAYNKSYTMAIADELSSFQEFNQKTNFADSINSLYPNAGLMLLEWEQIDADWIQLAVSRAPTASGTQTFRFRGTCTDTYQSTSDSAYVDFTLNLEPGTAVVTVDGGITGSKLITEVLKGEVTQFQDPGVVTAQFLTSDTENGTYTEHTTLEEPTNGEITYKQMTTDAGKWWKLRTFTEDLGGGADDSPPYGPTKPANASISEFSVDPIEVPVGQTTSKVFTGSYNYVGTWSMTYTDDSGWETVPWMPHTNISDEYNTLFGTSFTQMEWAPSNGTVTVLLATGPGQAAGHFVQTQLKLTDSITDSAGTDSNSDTVPQQFETT